MRISDWSSDVCSSDLFIAARPIYQADGLVQVEQDDKSGGLTASLGDMASLFGAPMETAAEIEILQSRMILSKVIDALNLEIEAEPEDRKSTRLNSSH